MRRIKRKEDEEGAMGVGTLIVFIAMVLVAAVAASVLINTAHKLQQQAEKTGDQAIREVSSSFMVKDVYGEDEESTPDGEIENLYLKIGLAAGAPAQNMDQTVIQIKNDTAETNLENESGDNGGSASASFYLIDEYIIEQDGGDGDGYLEQGDILKIKIDADAALNGEGLGTQESVSVQIIPKHGTPTYEEITTPPTITDTHIDLT